MHYPDRNLAERRKLMLDSFILLNFFILALNNVSLPIRNDATILVVFHSASEQNHIFCENLTFQSLGLLSDVNTQMGQSICRGNWQGEVEKLHSSYTCHFVVFF